MDERLLWGKSLRHMHAHWGLSYGYLLRLSVRNLNRRKRIRDRVGLGWPNTYVESLFASGADAYQDSLDYYRCIYGTCTIIWDSRAGRNTGGMGPAGCECEYASEPRDLVAGIVRKGKKLP